MALVTQTIPALYGGVSQQAAVQRNLNQVEEAVNCSFSVAEGASKRPPLECVTMLTSQFDEDLAVAWFQGPDNSWYVLTFPGDGTYRAYEAETGALVPLEGDSSGLDYLTTEDLPSKSLRFQRVGEKLVVINREKMCALASGDTEGSLAGTKQSLQDEGLDDAVNGSIWQITGSQDSPFTTYYVKRVGDRWVEWVRPEIPFKIDASTMPHQLELLPAQGNEENNVFRFQAAEWADRRVGDTTSNKAPSFIGQKINNVTVAGDRLVFLSKRSVCMSRVGEYTDFWRSTVTQVLDDDRIDVTAVDTETTDLLWMEPVSGQYVVFSKQDQYVLDGQPALTPRTVNLKPVTKYPVARDAAPVVIGPNVYFATQVGEHTHLRELFLQEDSVTLDASNVSSHAFKYIPKNIRDMAGHSSFDHVLVVPRDSSEIYSYQFLWAGDEKVMSAWGRWELAQDAICLSVQIIDQYAYVVYRYKDGPSSGPLFLGRFNLKRGDNHEGFYHLVNLDHLEKLNPDYNPTEDRTFFATKFPLVDSKLVVVRGAGWPDEGTARTLETIVGYNQTGDHSFSLPGDWSEGDLWIGYTYNQKVRLSEQFYYENRQPIMNARCQIRNMQVHFTDTTAMRIEVKSRGRDPFHLLVFPGLKQSYTSRTLGDEYLVLNQPQADTGVYDFPVLGKASDVHIDLINDTYLPANFQAAEWRGLVSRRMTR